MKEAPKVVRGSTFRGLGMWSVGILFTAASCTGSIGKLSNGGGTPGDGGDGGGRDSSSGGAAGSDFIVIPGTGGGGANLMIAKPTFECDDTKAPTSIGMRKLSTAQYQNTLRDMIKFALNGNDAQTMSVWSATTTAIDKFPNDDRQVDAGLPSSRQMNQALQQGHVEESYNIALAVAAQLTNAQRLGTVAGACATDTNTGNDNQCITDFINKFGERALRRPLAADEVTFYRSFYGTASAMDPLAWADLIAGFLTAPQFLYFVEHGKDAVANKASTYGLSSFELASRLSYHFLQTMPDEALWQVAKSGDTLLGDAEYKRQVDRLAGLAEARRSTKEFYTDFLRTQDVDAVDKNKDNAKFKLFAKTTVPSAMLRQAMIDDVVDMSQYYTWDKTNGKLGELLTSEASFAKSQELATIYGTTVWNGTGEPPLFPAVQERKGLFTRAAFHATGLVTTRPIIKGAHLRQSWLCDDVPPPDAGAANTPQDTNNRTTRQAVELITEQSGTTCKGCHQTYTNPLGFATESFDALGRYRAEELLFNGDQLAGSTPVNTRSLAQVHLDDPREVSGPGELMDRIAESGKVEACMARHYFRFTFARKENEDVDGCALEDMRKSISGNGTIGDFVRKAVLLPEFKQRQILTSN
jgi:Protein of unknown function (DUF1592)/Protein of unknown function (DUF1588)/Protein of unknown function (DUF1595)/Protein of unknown function (DUF1585)